ncbi:MAG: DUF1932 domain-containing protein [Granulosicoccus sp.]
MLYDQPDAPCKIGIVHPGQMGVTFAATLATVGHSVYWASERRSSSTVKRATQANLSDTSTLEALCLQSHYIFSICPPDQATAVAQQVADTGFQGIFIDCNAVSPMTSQQVAAIVEQQGATCVDGGIIGPPASSGGTTRLYLSGATAPEVATLFQNTFVDARAISPDIGSASALKMTYAGWTKGSMALLMTQFALARQQNVESALLDEWALSLPGLADQLKNACTSSAPKAWRFSGEMREIADTLENAGLPRGWFDAADASYQRLGDFKNQTDVDHQDVIDKLLNTATHH